MNSLCKLCLIYSRAKDLINMGMDQKLPDLLNYLADLLRVTESRTMAFVNSFNFVKTLTNDLNPYKHVKKMLNDVGLKLANVVEKYLEEKNWDLKEAMRVSAAANIVDTSVLGYEGKDLEEALFDKPVIEEFVDVPRNVNVYVVLDNAGESVIDILLAKALKIHGYKVYIVVRKGSYEIDVLKEDVPKVEDDIDVIETPDSSPPILYIDSGFIVAKGIANAEAYIEFGKAPSIHLLRAKCDVIARMFNVPKNSPIIVTGDTLRKYFNKFYAKVNSIS